MLSVDDLIRDVREYLIQQGEWENTVMLYTSGADKCCLNLCCLNLRGLCL